MISARLLLACTGILFLQACDSEPTGQVLAVVNGEEITQQELNAELAELGQAAAGDKQAIRRQVLQQIIERRLLAQVAKEEGLDRDPTYIIRERRLNEELLVQMYGAKTADTVRVPNSAAVQNYIQENPGKFNQRTAYLVDQISFDVPSDATVLKQLEADKTLADVEETLKSLKIEYAKGKNSVDSGNVPTAVLNQILALPAGEPFVIPSQGKVVVSVITGRQPVAMNQRDAVPMAAQSMRAESLGKLMQSRLDEAKATAKITYQPEFAPVAAPKTTGTSTK
jgi:peptidyl-prolyl cis-trans isomerase C